MNNSKIFLFIGLFLTSIFSYSQVVYALSLEPSDVPDDPIFQLTFPQRGMLDEVDYRHMRDLVVSGASQNEIKNINENICH